MLHLAQFCSLTKIKFASELFYVTELGKYAFTNFQQPLSLKDIALADSFKTQQRQNSWFYQYFMLGINEGWLVPDSSVEVKPPVYDILYNNRNFTNILVTTSDVPAVQPQGSNVKDITTIPKKVKLKYIPMDEEGKDWLWISPYDVKPNEKMYKYLNEMSEMPRSLAFGGGVVSYKWLSVVAYVTVQNLMVGVPRTFQIIITNEYLGSGELALVPFNFLREYSRCINDDVIKFDWFTDVGFLARKTQDYKVWLSYTGELGMKDRVRTVNEKYAYLQSETYHGKRGNKPLGKLQVGDFVVVHNRYERQSASRSKTIINSCIAQVQYYDTTKITLLMLHSNQTYWQGKKQFINRPDNVRDMYKGSVLLPYDWRTSVQSFDLVDVGFDHSISTEDTLITRLLESKDDMVYLEDAPDDSYLEPTFKGFLSQNEGLYWLCADAKKRGRFTFSERRFIYLYLDNKTPKYVTWTKTGSVEADA